MNKNQIVNCPICKRSVINPKVLENQFLVECNGCGIFRIDEETIEDIPSLIDRKKYANPILSFAVRNATESTSQPLINFSFLENALKNTQLPSPQEQLDRMIVWFGNQQETPTTLVRPNEDTTAYIGAIDQNGLFYVIKRAVDLKLIEGILSNATGGVIPSFHPMNLTFDGWEYLANLMKGKSNSRNAFMAMPFGQDNLDQIFSNHLKPAVLETGFHLRRLDENQKAGLIDDHLRVEIRQAKFLIAELTGNNNGAYWEAGYAEGLGKPVIYTCEEKYFDLIGVHFDTNHHLIVTWNLENIVKSMEKLKATIRATLPEDAKPPY